MSPSSSPSSDTPNKPNFALIGAIAFLAISVVVAGIAVTGFDPASLNLAPIPGTDQANTESTPAPALATPTDAPATAAPIDSGPRWIIRLAPMAADAPDIGEALDAAINAALQESSVAAADVRLERVPAGAGALQLEDIYSITQGPAEGIYAAWEAGDDGQIRLYLIDTRLPPMTTVDEALAVWLISAPGESALVVRADGDMRLPAGLITGALELWNGDTDRAATRFTGLQALPSDVPVEAQASNQAAILFGLGQAQAAQGAAANALESYSQALRLQPDFPAAALDRAALYQAFGDFNTALPTYEAAQGDIFTRRQALYNLAAARASAGDTAAALQAASDLIAIMPQSAEALNLRGVIAYQGGDSESALADFMAAGGLKPDSRAALLNQAAAYMALGRYPQAIETYDMLISLAPDDASLHLKQGLAFAAAGDQASAGGAFDQALALDNQYAAAYVARAQLEFDQGEFNQAITDANQALTIDDQNGQAHRVIADSLLAQEDFKQAEAHYTAALEQGVANADVYAGRGWARHRLFKIAGAIQDYEQALALGDADPTLLLQLGFATYDAGRHEESLGYFQQAINAGLDSAEAHAGLAIALDANLKRAEANTEYQKAIGLDGQFAEREFLSSQPLWSSGAIGRAMSIVKRLP